MLLCLLCISTAYDGVCNRTVRICWALFFWKSIRERTLGVWQLEEMFCFVAQFAPVPRERWKLYALRQASYDAMLSASVVFRSLAPALPPQVFVMIVPFRTKHVANEYARTKSVIYFVLVLTKWLTLSFCSRASSVVIVLLTRSSTKLSKAAVVSAATFNKALVWESSLSKQTAPHLRTATPWAQLP